MYEQKHPSKRGPYLLKSPSNTIIYKVVRQVKTRDKLGVEEGTKLVSAVARGRFKATYPTMQWVTADKDTIGLLAFDALRWAVKFAKFMSKQHYGTFVVMEAEGFDPYPILYCAGFTSNYNRDTMVKAQVNPSILDNYWKAPAGTVACDVLRTRRVRATVRHGKVTYCGKEQGEGAVRPPRDTRTAWQEHYGPKEGYGA